MVISFIGELGPSSELVCKALEKSGATVKASPAPNPSAIFDQTARAKIVGELESSDLVIAQNSGLLFASLAKTPYLWLPSIPDAVDFPFTKFWIGSWLEGRGEGLLLSPLYRKAIAGATAAIWLNKGVTGLTLCSHDQPYHLLLKSLAVGLRSQFADGYQQAYGMIAGSIQYPVTSFRDYLTLTDADLDLDQASNQLSTELRSAALTARESSRPQRSFNFAQRDEIIDAAIADANNALADGELARVLEALAAGLDLVGWEPRLITSLATVLNLAEAREIAVGILENAILFDPSEQEFTKALAALEPLPATLPARSTVTVTPQGLKLLYVGNSSADYLAKCHEAFRTGMRAVLNMRMFGEGYDGYDPSLKSFQEIVNRVYPNDRPDIVFADYSGSAHPMDFPYAGLAELDVPKVIGVGDFWEVTEKHFDEFVANLHKFRISVVQWYFPQPIAKMSALPFANILIPVSFDPTIFNDWGEPKRYDVGFLAAGTTDYTDFYPERWLIHQAMLKQPDISYLWAQHPGWERTNKPRPLVGELFSRAINSCRLFITTGGKYRNPHAKYVEILASKTVLLADEPHGAELLRLEDGVNYVKITQENFLEKIRYYLARPELCAEIAENGYRTALRYHSCYARAVDFMDQITQPAVVERIAALRERYQATAAS